MAERNYDLVVQERQRSSHASNKKWYKESMKTKYLKPVRPGDKLNSYDTNNWLFLRRGMDDFRDGLPPIGSHITKPEKGRSPLFRNEFVRISELKQPAALKRLNRYQTYLSKCTPHQQQQRNYIAAVEEGLLNHPLALYPHLEESVAPEIFESIVEILDPQFTALELREDELDLLGKLDDDDDAGSVLHPRSNRQASKMSTISSDEMRPKPDPASGLECSVRNIYKWLPQKDDAKDSKKNKEKEKLWPTSQSETEHIKQVTREFCEWVADLGGESNNIEESTITSLFASGYETKPALSVPIHVVDLANVPHELRMSALVPPPAPPEKPTSPVPVKPKKKETDEDEPTFVKFRYGAWYLNPNTWKKMGYYEPLEDPKQLKEHEMSEAKKKSHELTEELATMHAAKAFDDFIVKKNTRKPEFLAEIADIQRRAVLEEERQAEAEALARQKIASQSKKIV